MKTAWESPERLAHLDRLHDLHRKRMKDQRTQVIDGEKYYSGRAAAKHLECTVQFLWLHRRTLKPRGPKGKKLYAERALEAHRPLLDEYCARRERQCPICKRPMKSAGGRRDGVRLLRYYKCRDPKCKGARREVKAVPGHELPREPIPTRQQTPDQRGGFTVAEAAQNLGLTVQGLRSACRRLGIGQTLTPAIAGGEHPKRDLMTIISLEEFNRLKKRNQVKGGAVRPANTRPVLIDGVTYQPLAPAMTISGLSAQDLSRARVPADQRPLPGEVRAVLIKNPHAKRHGMNKFIWVYRDEDLRATSKAEAGNSTPAVLEPAPPAAPNPQPAAKRRGRKTSDDTMELYKACYDAYCGPQKLSAACRTIRAHFGAEALTEKSNLRLYARRYAERCGLPFQRRT
jgi:hypothetical protein